jgi:PHD/YefM family antitoxin component YafN of YafNO toxin-antitoxin module
MTEEEQWKALEDYLKRMDLMFADYEGRQPGRFHAMTESLARIEERLTELERRLDALEWQPDQRKR